MKDNSLNFQEKKPAIFEPKIKTSNDAFNISNTIAINFKSDTKEDIFGNFNLDRKEYNIQDENVIPSKDELISNLEYRNKSRFLYSKIIKRENIVINESKIKDVETDGNFFFRNLSYFFTGNENYYPFFRECIYIYLNKNKYNILQHHPYIFIEKELKDLIDYIPTIRENGTFATELEIHYASTLFNINIAVYLYNPTKDSNLYTFYNYYNNTNYNNDLLVLIYYQIKKHYFQIIYEPYNSKNNINTNSLIIKENNNISKLENQILDNNKINPSLISEIEDLIQKYKNLSLKSKNFNDNNQLKNAFIDNYESKYKNGYRYPSYPNHKYGKDMLHYIRLE